MHENKHNHRQQASSGWGTAFMKAKIFLTGDVCIVIGISG